MSPRRPYIAVYLVGHEPTNTKFYNLENLRLTVTPYGLFILISNAVINPSQIKIK